MPTTLKEKATTYESKKTLNIADLDKVDLSWPVENRTGIATKQDYKGKDYDESYQYQVMIVNEIEYRVPNTVLEEIQKMVKLVPDLKYVKVERTGSGLGTKYAVEKVDEVEQAEKVE